MDSIKTGLCQCGCNLRTSIAKRNRAEESAIKGQPKRFISGHNSRRAGYKVEDRGYETPCWIWRGKPTPGGYGKVKVGGKTIGAHHLYVEAGPGEHRHHLCGQKMCVRPDHITVLSRAEHAAVHPSVKLSKEQVHAIRNSRESRRVLADRYGVHMAHIDSIRAGRRRRLCERQAPYAV